MVEKTNAARWLDARGIPYRLTVYDVAGAFHSGAEAATLLGVPAAEVYKTLVLLREGSKGVKPFLVMLPADREVDTKRLARALGEKKLRMATQREAETLTGLEVGGISALAVRPGRFEVILDASARRLSEIHVSAGARGMELTLAVNDLVAATGARWVDAAAAPTPPATGEPPART